MADGKGFVKKGVFEERLIKAVFKRPSVYNKKHKDHNKRKKLARIWASISNEIGVSASICKTRWRSLKDRYYSLCKEVKGKSGCVQDEAKSISWQYFEQLSFLTNGQVPAADDGSPESEDDSPVNSPENFVEIDSTSNNTTALDLQSVNLQDHSYDLTTTEASNASNIPVFSNNKKRSHPNGIESLEEKINENMNSESQTDLGIISQSQQKQDSRNQTFISYLMSELNELSESDQDDVKLAMLELILNKKRACRSQFCIK